MERDEIMGLIKKYKWTIVFSVLIVIIYMFDKNASQKALDITFANIKTMLSILPAIFVIIGLLDVWVPKDTMIKYMGESSGLKGIVIALFLGSVAAGPLYVAFPIAAMLLKKGARLAYVLFFLGVWSSSKLPIMLYEYTSFGGTFTFSHIFSSLIIYLIGSFVMEKLLSNESINDIYTKSQAL